LWAVLMKGRGKRAGAHFWSAAAGPPLEKGVSGEARERRPSPARPAGKAGQRL